CAVTCCVIHKTALNYYRQCCKSMGYEVARTQYSVAASAHYRESINSLDQPETRIGKNFLTRKDDTACIPNIALRTGATIMQRYDALRGNQRTPCLPITS